MAGGIFFQTNNYESEGNAANVIKISSLSTVIKPKRGIRSRGNNGRILTWGVPQCGNKVLRGVIHNSTSVPGLWHWKFSHLLIAQSG